MNLSSRTTFRIRRALTLVAVGVSALAINAGSASASMSVSVYGVCHLSTAYGPVYTGNANGTAYAYWDTNGDQNPDLIAISIDGNSSVDVAAILNTNDEATYIASCGSSAWTSVARIVAQPKRYVPTGLYELEDETASRIGGLNMIGPDYPLGESEPLGDY
jgi:hypothetical protein